jgi:hypothetical protein
MCEKTDELINKIDEVKDEIDKAESAISSAEYELGELKDELEDISFDFDKAKVVDLFLQVRDFITHLEKKTCPCRVATINPIYSEDDSQVVISMDTTYFDWGFTDILTTIHQIQEELK